MKLSSREIVAGWLRQKVNLTGIERALESPFGILRTFQEIEGPAPPEYDTLLNMINVFPQLLEVAEGNYEHTPMER